VTYPSSQTIPPAGALPPGAGAEIRLNAALGEREGAWIVVRGARRISASVDTGSLGPVRLRLRWGHFVSFGPSRVPDALLPWDGGERAPEELNQPLYVQALVPADAEPGWYSAAVRLTVDGNAEEVPLSVRVFGVRIPAPGDARGSLVTSFHVVPPSYVGKAAELYGYGSNPERLQAHDALFSFLAEYRINPASWGFGEPRTADGYRGHAKWWLDSAGNMARAVGGARFSALRIPVSNNRASAGNRIAGLDPDAPEAWCDFLGAVRSFWLDRGWLNATVPYLYTLDEPGREGQKLLARHAAVAHRCFPGSKVIMTGSPSPTGANEFLWDNRDGDDVDIFVVLNRRFYGRFTVPSRREAGEDRSRALRHAIEKARARGKTIWTYTYLGVAGTPGLGADERLANPRLLMLWTALENVQGFLWGQGTTSYGEGNPFESVGRNGASVLVYPGEREPIPSARLEQLRDGIEDWAILDGVRRARGAAGVRAILGAHGLFSADAGGVRLACHLGCELKSETKYSWPLWSSDALTPARIEAARLAALRQAGS
jgi:hypothetical protein